jgi:hypothetical protein
VFIPCTIDSEFIVVILLNCKPITHSFESITVIGELIVIVLLSYGHGRIVLMHNVLLFTSRMIGISPTIDDTTVDI